MALPHETPDEAAAPEREWGEEQADPAGPVLAGVATGAAPPDLRARLAPEIPDPGELDQIGIQVLRDLLRIETRPGRFRRVLRVWEGKVGAAIRNRDLDLAAAWMRAVTEDPVYPHDFGDHVASAMEALSRPALIDDLIVWLVDQDAIEAAGPLLSEWGEPIVRRIVELMVIDDPPVNRRYLVDMLGLIGRSDSRLLIAHVADHRWFIVRNVAIALGHTGRLAAMPPLRSLLDHEDHRVRVEALRGLAAIDNDAAVSDLVRAFADPNPRVRQATVSLLRASPSDQVVPMLASVVEAGRLGHSETERLVEVIAERRDPAAVEVLERLAGKRMSFGSARVARDTARRELMRRAS